MDDLDRNDPRGLAGLGRSGSAQDATGWGLPVGAAQPRFEGEVYRSPLPPGTPGPPMPLDPTTGLPTQEGFRQVVREGIAQALCYGNGCIIQTQPSHLVHPGWRGVRRTIETRAVLFDTSNVEAALRLGTGELGASALFIGPDEGVLGFRIIPAGRSARIVSVSIVCENGDGSRVFARVEVEGSRLVMGDTRLTNVGVNAPLENNAYAILNENETAKIVVKTDPNDNVSPYYLSSRLVIDEWSVSRIADSIEGVSF